jgi:mannan endo-1,4-beta-mannosidase
MVSLLRLFSISMLLSVTGLALAEPNLESAGLTSGFVSTDGAHFVLDGKPFYFQGTNFYRLSLIERQSDEQVYQIMHELAAKGMKTIRLWGFSCGINHAQAMLKSVSKNSAEYDEIALRRMDLAIDAARNANLKVILPLVNAQEDYCPMGWWVKQITGKDNSQLFYSDPDVREAFKRHIGRILSRANTTYLDRRHENVTYANDPTIMAIELANEPHTDAYFEASNHLQPGEIIYNWLKYMSDFIRSVDPNHLIASGEEGYKVNPASAAESAHHTWLSDGAKGTDFIRNLALPNINFATVHAYPTHWLIPTDDLPWFNKFYIEDRAEIAHKMGKPVILEEVGISNQENPYLGYTAKPEYWLEQMFAAANASNYDGTMIWELVPTGSEEGDFIYDFTSPVAEVVFKQAAYMNKH